MTSQSDEIGLFSSFQLGPTRLRSRIVMAPMTRSRAGDGSVPSELARTYYVQRASAGLIVTEATQVSQQGQGYIGTPGIYTDDQVRGWSRIADAVHAEGGRIFLQLWHVGRISHRLLQPGGALPVAPSAIAPEGETYTYEGPRPFETPRALELREIPDVVAQFAEGARRAKLTGVDGVEIHGANGYLIDQFLRDGSNRRVDSYGGSVENRARFLLDVTDAVIAVWGRERVAVRLSPTNPFNSMNDSNPLATFGYAADRLSERGIAYLHLVEGALDGAGSTDRITHELRARFRGPLMLNGGYTRERAEHALRSGLADLISFGTLFISNPDLPERLRRGAPLVQPDPSTFYVGGPKGYIDYPLLGG